MEYIKENEIKNLRGNVKESQLETIKYYINRCDIKKSLEGLAIIKRYQMEDIESRAIEYAISEYIEMTGENIDDGYGFTSGIDINYDFVFSLYDREEFCTLRDKYIRILKTENDRKIEKMKVKYIEMVSCEQCGWKHGRGEDTYVCIIGNILIGDDYIVGDNISEHGYIEDESCYCKHCFIEFIRDSIF